MNDTEYRRSMDEINRHPLTDYITLTPSKGGMFVCPICKSGTGHNGTGALKLYTDGKKPRVICYAGDCFGEHGEDTLGALGRIWGKTPGEVLQQLGYTEQAISTPSKAQTATATPTKPSTEQTKPPAPTADYTAQYAEWHQALLQDSAALAYLEKRGINRATIDALNLGYCPNLGYGPKQYYRAPRIVFPYSADYYKARRIDGNDAEAKYIPSATGTHIYNAAALQDPDGEERFTPIVIVEGELDAAAVYQGGVKRVIALGATSHKEEFVEQAKQINPAAVYILALDNDPSNPDPKKDRPGQRAQAELEKLLDAKGLTYISADTAALYGEHTDAAEAAKSSTAGAEFWPRLMGYIIQGYDIRSEKERQAKQEAYYRTGPGMVDLFLKGVKSECYKPIPTGIQAVDRIIGGGLIKQTIVMLGAAPGIGKTTLASQIVENIAKAGTDVLFINLEMSREQLLARSLARIAYRSGHHGISTMDILQGYRWTSEIEKAVTKAADEYKATIADHLIYNPGDDDTTDLDRIMEKIHAEQQRIGNAPIVVLDYLQLVTSRAEGREADSMTTIKRTMQAMKEYAIKENTIAIVITANNRESMKKNKSDLTSGRDSSSIEYGADLHIGLTKDDSGTSSNTITLTVNKNRHGPAGDKQRTALQFNGACSMFFQLDTIHDDGDIIL